MSDSSKAVFLSYASQDAEAARRICEALRALGVEVWFDQSELRGGDAWDQKIRRQIKECALFVPVISASTQARLEGYFRLEWLLAVERSRLMAEERAFLVPVVIDDTSDAAATVPEKFRGVQWTRLREGETTAAFCHQVSALLGGSPMEAARLRPAEPRDRAAPSAPAPTQRGRGVATAMWIVAGAVVAAALFLLTRHAPAPATPATGAVAQPPASAKPAAPQTEVQRLLAQIWVLYEKQNDALREDWLAAEDLGAQAVKLEPFNADAWAAYAQATLGSTLFGYPQAEPHYHDAFNRAERAMSLGPNALEPRFALANCYRVNSATRDEGERMLRELAQRAPTDKRILRILASTLRMQKKPDESLALLDRILALPGGDPIALYGKFSTLREDGRFPEAEAMIDRILAERRAPYGYLWKIFFLIYVHDDLPQARVALEKIPGSFLLKEDGAFMSSQLWLWSGEPDRCLAVLNGQPQDFVGAFYSLAEPRAFLVGQAHQSAGRPAAAVASWRAALQKTEQRLVAEPGDALAVYWKGRLLASLGERTEAERSLETYRQLTGENSQAKFYLALAWASLGRADEAVRNLGDVLRDQSSSIAYQAIWRSRIRHDPALDPLRGHAGFQALVKSLPAPPSEKP